MLFAGRKRTSAFENKFSVCFFEIYGRLRCRIAKSILPCMLLAASGIHAASENPQRISTATDAGGSMQQRRFCTAKTRHQQMYMDVHLLMRYLYPLFSKALVLFPSANNIYIAAETHLSLINVRGCASFRKLFISSISTYINSG